MKIALASAKCVDRDVEHNLAQMEKFLHRAKEQGAELICFPEAFLQGFYALDWDYAADRERAVSTDGPVLARLKELTRGPVGLPGAVPAGPGPTLLAGVH